ncbi:unnamed protein product [Polarella glacialis]|uniref:Uncharacterized protein n=1 Tax=Polarella glacialis TaxID=89957 RepID=A0A813E6C1_POLGL|nr:unnamed protein product [Polarella glacialis]CAE8633439.1 unnamed protein product [Polarella glacialis]
MKLPQAETVSLSWRLGLASALMVALGYPGEIQLTRRQPLRGLAADRASAADRIDPGDEAAASLSWRLGLASALMVALGYPGEIQLTRRLPLRGLAADRVDPGDEVAAGGDGELELEAGLGQRLDGGTGLHR